LQELFKDLSQEDIEAWLRIYRTIIRRSTQQHANKADFGSSWKKAAFTGGLFCG